MHFHPNPLSGEFKLGETHCDTCGEWRVLVEDGDCVFCYQRHLQHAVVAGEAALDSVRAVLSAALNGNVHPADLMETVEEEIAQAQGCGGHRLHEAHTALHELYERGVH